MARRPQDGVQSQMEFFVHGLLAPGPQARAGAQPRLASPPARRTWSDDKPVRHRRVGAHVSTHLTRGMVRTGRPDPAQGRLGRRHLYSSVELLAAAPATHSV